MRVVIAEDEALLREGLLLVLGAHGVDVVGVAADAEHLLELTEQTTPDLVVTDIRMPPTGTDEGLRAALTIRARMPEVAVVVLSQHVQPAYAVELLDQHPTGVGYLLKQRIADMQTFTGDLLRVCAGGTVLDPEVIASMVRQARRDDDAIGRLTDRQQEVLTLMAEGRSNAAIAQQLSITEGAVVRHASHIYDELGLVASDADHRRVLAVVNYLARARRT